MGSRLSLKLRSLGHPDYTPPGDVVKNGSTTVKETTMMKTPAIYIAPQDGLFVEYLFLILSVGKVGRDRMSKVSDLRQPR